MYAFLDKKISHYFFSGVVVGCSPGGGVERSARLVVDRRQLAVAFDGELVVLVQVRHPASKRKGQPTPSKLTLVLFFWCCCCCLGLHCIDLKRWGWPGLDVHFLVCEIWVGVNCLLCFSLIDFNRLRVVLAWTDGFRLFKCCTLLTAIETIYTFFIVFALDFGCFEPALELCNLIRWFGSLSLFRIDFSGNSTTWVSSSWYCTLSEAIDPVSFRSLRIQMDPIKYQ